MKESKKWYSPSSIDWLFVGIIVMILLIGCVSACTGQTTKDSTNIKESSDSLKKQNAELRSTLKSIPTTEILNLFELYDILLKNCELAKDKIIQTTTATITENTKKLKQVEQALTESREETVELKQNLADTKTNIQDNLKLNKKASRKLFFERAGIVVASSATTIVVLYFVK